MQDQLFGSLLEKSFCNLYTENNIAVAVSGGPDSMALLHLLSCWSDQNAGATIHALTVDHGLRKESAAEAKNVHRIVKNWPKTKHSILVWDDDKPEKGIQEAARNARYALMEQYCIKNNITHLFLAHHADDQIETFLFRLAKGSGIDGLSAMKPQQKRGEIILCRPVLDFSKIDLIEYCKENLIDFVNDPSNEKDDFARIRLRKVLVALEREGFSYKRLVTTTKRLNRAREALDYYAEEALNHCAININTNRIEINLEKLLFLPHEMIFRLILKAMYSLANYGGYGPRTEKIEDLVDDILSMNFFRKRTLGGVIFSKSKDGGKLILEIEHP